MVSIPVRRAQIDYDYNELDGFRITVEVGSGYTHSANIIKNLIDSGVPLEFVLKKPIADKTQKQIATAWAAMNEMAKALEIPADEIYHSMIKQYGKVQFAIIPTKEAENFISVHSESGHKGNFGEIVGISQADKDCSVVKLYYGCSCYSKDEMSRFIDGIEHEYDELFGA